MEEGKDQITKLPVRRYKYWMQTSKNTGEKERDRKVS